MSDIKLDETIFSIRRLLMSVLWPSFLMAGASMGILFGVFEPGTLALRSDGLEVSNTVIYTIAFFIMWLLGALSSGLTAMLMCKFK